MLVLFWSTDQHPSQPYQCKYQHPECPYYAAQTTNFESHMTSHHGPESERKYLCKVLFKEGQDGDVAWACSAQYKKPQDLFLHRRRVHGWKSREADDHTQRIYDGGPEGVNYCELKHFAWAHQRSPPLGLNENFKLDFELLKPYFQPEIVQKAIDHLRITGIVTHRADSSDDVDDESPNGEPSPSQDTEAAIDVEKPAPVIHRHEEEWYSEDDFDDDDDDDSDADADYETYPGSLEDCHYADALGRDPSVQGHADGVPSALSATVAAPVSGYHGSHRTIVDKSRYSLSSQEKQIPYALPGHT